MANNLTPRIFAAHEADEVAHLVADHDPETSQALALLPQDEEAAAAGVRALVECLHGLPRSIRAALKRAADSAGYLSDDRLQGLAELIQNADDLEATEATLTVDSARSRLLFSHNGTALTLHDVWALAIPWLSLKVADEEKVGRFGIGLKTLHSLSDILEVHQGHFRVRFDANTVTPIPESTSGPSVDTSATTFAVPFAPGAITIDDLAKWLTHWDDAGLVFLRCLSTVRLVDESQNEILCLEIDPGTEEPVKLAHGPGGRRLVTARDGRQWLVYSRRAPAPVEAQRAGKAQGRLTPIAFAFALFEGDTGHIHVGLPVCPVGLPFRMLAQFDPQPTRRDIADTDWNLALIPLLSDLWHDAALALFQATPIQGWAVVPLASEFEADGRTSGRLRNQFDEHLMHRARTKFAGGLTLDVNGTRRALQELAYEAPELTGVLSAADVREVTGQPGSLVMAVRSANDRWRDVLDDLRDLAAKVAVLVSVEDAVVLLDDEERSPEFVADLVAVTVEAGQGAALMPRACLVLDDGTRALPDSRDGLDVLLPANPGPLWDLLGIGTHLHAAFTDHPHWKVIRDWLRDEGLLRTSASDADALRILADAGGAGVQLPEPVTDEQADGIRRSLESVSDTQRQELGEGIGQAVEVDAVTFDAKDNRQRVHARPCDAYFIEREANTWWVAAGKTPGLSWIDRRYSINLKTDGSRNSIGAQRLFRLLGAEVAPRIESHPANKKRFVYFDPGVPRWAKDSPSRRDAILKQHQATYTVEDWVAPDLDAVLSNIAKDRDAAQRRRRASAVLATLTRASERLSDYASVMSAAENRGWVDKGQVEAWWISSAASIPWLTSEKGKAAQPDQLRIKSPATVALYGDDPERYLSPSLDSDAYRDVLARIGVAGDPTVAELIEKLGEVRAETATTPESAEDLAAPLYQALTPQVRGQRLGRLGASAARTAFSRGDGLIATRAGWRRPSVVLAGPPIFGVLRDFVPSVSGTDALWALLAIPRPTFSHARSVLGDLARKKALTSDEKLVMLEALRLLAAAPAGELAKLKRSAVWVGDRWERNRPVFATHSSLIAQVLRGRVPVWEPGGALAQLDALIEPYGLTRLDAPHGQVLDADDATDDPDLTQVFSRSVANLRADLALSDPQAEESLRFSWDELAGLSVMQLPGLRVRLAEPTHGLDQTVELDTWLDPATGVFYVVDESAAGSPSSGAYAVASVFSGDSRRIAHDWVAAWSIGLEGHRAEAVTTAARLDAQRKKERDDRSEERLRDLAEQSKNRRTQKSGRGEGSARDSNGSKQQSPESKPKPTRQLVDPDGLNLKNEAGEIIGGSSTGSSTSTKRSKGRQKGQPKDPDATNPKKKPSGDGGRGARNYTDEERESVGLELVRRVLGGNEEEIVDIRHQRNVGADAIDELMNFFELKVYAGRFPENVSLTSAEFRRARATEQFFLVVVGNVERGIKDPEVRIITDPLHHLSVLPQGSVSLGGVRDATSLRYTFEKPKDDDDE